MILIHDCNSHGGLQKVLIFMGIEICRFRVNVRAIKVIKNVKNSVLI